MTRNAHNHKFVDGRVFYISYVTLSWKKPKSRKVGLGFGTEKGPRVGVGQ